MKRIITLLMLWAIGASAALAQEYKTFFLSIKRLGEVYQSQIGRAHV